MRTLVSDRLTVAALLTGVFETVHPFADQWAQTTSQAVGKGLDGPERVDRDGKPDPHGQHTATGHGQRSALGHVLSYSAVQTAATVAVTSALGYRIKPSALAVAALINGVTHYGIDRRKFLLRAAKWARRDGYIGHATVVRRIDEDGVPVVDTAGPGTALLELDQAAHRILGLVAATVAAIAATRD